MVHENWRHPSHYEHICDWVGGGRIGDLRQVLMLARTSGFLPGADGRMPALVRQPMLAGLDRMLLMKALIHHVDAIRSVVGELELLGAVLGSDTDALRGEDRASLLLGGGGVAVSVIGDFRTRGAPPVLQDDLNIQGTHGATTLTGDTLRLIRGDTVEETPRIDLAADYAASYRAMISFFMKAVRMT